MNDVLEQSKTMPIPIKSGKGYSGNVGPNVEGDGSLYSSHKFTILYLVGISIACIGLCVIACLAKFDKKPAQTQSMSSRSRSRSARRNGSQIPPRYERSGGVWWKIFAKKGENPTSKAWPALRRFASRSKSQAEDIEMLRQPRNAGNASGNPVQGGPNLHNGARHTRRLQRPEHLRTDRSRIEGWRAEMERRRARDAWERLEAQVRATYEPDSTPAAPSQPPTYLPTAPEPIARPNANRIDNVTHPIFDEESPSPSITEVPPPTYAEQTGDEIASLSDYQNPAHAAEEVRDVQGLPPYAPPAVALNSALRPIFL